MSFTKESAYPEYQNKTTKIEKNWDHNTWDASQVVTLLAGSTDMITVISTRYDHDGEAYRASVHKKLLCAYSAHYTAILKHRSSAAKEDAIMIDLPWCQSKTLVGWLYTGNMIDEDLNELLELYVFADQKKMLALRRFIMSKIIEEYYLDCRESMPYLERLSHNCGLFRYLVDLWAARWSQNTGLNDPYQIEELVEHEKVPRMFFYQALRKLAMMVDDKECIKAALNVSGNYHEHLNTLEWANTCIYHGLSCRKPNDGYYQVE